MASTGSKGNRKRTSTLQKAHYQAYRLVDKGKINLIKRLKTRIRRNKAATAKAITTCRGCCII